MCGALGAQVVNIVTARNEVGARLCFYMCLFTGGRGGISACIAGGIPACLAAGLQRGVVSQHALQVPRPTPRGEVEGSDQRGSPGPHPTGKFRGLAWGLQAHNGGVCRPTPRWGGSPGPHPGCGVSRPTPGVWSPGPHPEGGVSQHTLRKTPHGYCCGRYASYWNAF